LFTDPPPSAIYTLSLHDALPIWAGNPADLEAEIAALLRVRAPEAPVDAAKNAVMVRMLRTLTADDLELRTLRRIDVDVVLNDSRSEEHTSELQSQSNLVCRLLLE